MGLGEGQGCDHLSMEGRPARDARRALVAYDAIRHRLPAPALSGPAQEISGLLELADRYDAFLLDAFGVLNVGETAIPGAVDAIRDLQRRGKHVLVLTNGASHPADVALAKYRRLGFDFVEEDVVSSRDALREALKIRPERSWGAMALTTSRLDELGATVALLGDDPADYEAPDGFILLGSRQWTELRQRHLIRALKRRPRPVLVGNPDLVAPRENGLSLEPGHFAHALAARTGVEPIFFGKPFPDVYRIALSRIPGVPRSSVLAVGDTPHTDVLGGANAGIDTLLLRGFGLLAGLDPDVASGCGIAPTWIADGF